MNLQFEQTRTLAAATETPILEQRLDYMADRGSIEISNDGDSNATTAFKLQAQDHPNGEFYTVLSAFATLGNTLIAFTNDPASLAHNAKAHLRLDLKGVYAIRLLATSTSGTIISVRGGFTVIARN